MIIPFVAFMQIDNSPLFLLLSLIIFVAASLTDLLDGKIARKFNLVTNFGKLMDPLADKLLVMSAMLIFVEKAWAPAYVVIIILAREFLVTSVRLLAANQGVVIAADKWGKIKTVVQMAWIIVTMLWMYIGQSGILDGKVGMSFPFYAFSLIIVLMYLSVALTVVSGVNYLIKAKEFILKDK